jgi:hypothetical protein
MNTKTQTITLPAPLHEVLHALSKLSYPMACRVTNETCNAWTVKRNITIRGMESADVTLENSLEWADLVRSVQAHCELNRDTGNLPLLSIRVEGVPRVPKIREFTAEDFPPSDALQAAGALKSELKRLVAELDAVGLALLARSIFGEDQDPHAALETLAGAIRAAVHDIATADATVNHARNQRRQQDAPLHDAARKAQRDLLQAVAYLERQIEHRPREHAEKLKALRAAAGLTEAEALRAVPAPDVGALVAELADARVRLQDVALYLEDTDHHTPPVWLKLEGAAQ